MIDSTAKARAFELHTGFLEGDFTLAAQVHRSWLNVARQFHFPGVETESQKEVKGLGKIIQLEVREEAVFGPKPAPP